MARLLRMASWIRHHASVSIALTLALICVVVGFATGFWLLFRLAYVIALAIPLVWWWTRSMIRDLDVEVLRRTQRVSQGQPLEGQVLLKSTSWLPKVWLEVEDRSSVPSYRSKRVVTIGARGSEGWSYAEVARQRGLYQLGPVVVTAADPFGFFRMTRSFGEPTTVLVYPAAPDLPNFYIPPANLPGEGRFRRLTHNVTPTYAGLRGYVAGDSYNRIHWPMTARTGDLMVKVFELDPSSDIWILLDLEKGVHLGSGEDSTEEVAVTITASIARYFIQANRTVGLLSFGSDLRVDEPDRGQNHHTRLLESLALARAVGDVALERLLIEASRRFGRHTTVVAVTPSPDEGWAMTLMSLAGRGVKVAAVLLESETWGATGSSLDVYGTLAAGGVYTYTVKRTDDLPRALGGRGEIVATEVSG